MGRDADLRRPARPGRAGAAGREPRDADPAHHASTGLYVSLWYFLAAFAWTGLVYFMGNYLPQFWVPGTAGAAITGLFIHDLVGLFVTPIGWGLMYFFVPLLLRKPIWSHALSLIGFWGLAFFYPMQGVHHFLFSPIPMYAQYGAVVATIAVEIVVLTVHRQLLRDAARPRRRASAATWRSAGSTPAWSCTRITCFQCAFQVTLTFQKIIHFTDWVVGARAHGDVRRLRLLDHRRVRRAVAARRRAAVGDAAAADRALLAHPRSAWR